MSVFRYSLECECTACTEQFVFCCMFACSHDYSVLSSFSKKWAEVPNPLNNLGCPLGGLLSINCVVKQSSGAHRDIFNAEHFCNKIR